MPRETFLVTIAGRPIEVERDGGTLSVQGRPINVSLAETGPGHYSLLVDGKSLVVAVEPGEPGTFRLRSSQRIHVAEVLGRRERLLRDAQGGDARSRHHHSVRSPMPGLIVKVHVAPGDTVRAGDPLVVLEAMKMENEIRATHEGVVERVHVRPADAVLKNAPLIEFESR